VDGRLYRRVRHPGNLGRYGRCVLVFRRRRAAHAAAPTDFRRLDEESASLTEAIGESVVADVELLDARIAVLDARIAALESRFDDANEAAIVQPEQADVLDVQVRAAKLSAELHLVTLELRHELERLRTGAGASAETA
jgi:hypothetical protein